MRKANLVKDEFVIFVSLSFAEPGYVNSQAASPAAWAHSYVLPDEPGLNE
jgi:hypothetical protein